MHVAKFTGTCLRVNQKAGKTLGQKVPLYDPGDDAKSLVVLEISKATSGHEHVSHKQLLQGNNLWINV